MDAWVNRSYETRKREVVLKKGYITRPMNSFMMYRSAYAERTKMWCTQNNHQIVSSVSGESWPMEPPEIRNLYIEYARQEREIHASTHPDYKFSPAKGEGGNRKRKESELHEDEEELSDLEDADLGNKAHKDRHGKGRPKKIKPAPQDSRDQQIYVELPSSHERSTYQYNNPGRSMPVPLGSHQLNPGQYYQTRAQPIVDQLYHPSSRVEDVTIHRTEAPVQYGLAPPLIGLPGANHDHLLDPHPWQDVNFMESQLSGYPHMNDSLINAAGGHLHIDPSLDDHISNIVQDYMPSYLPGTGSLPGEQQGLQDFGQGNTPYSVSGCSSLALQVVGMNFPYSMPSEPDLAALHNEGIILDRSGAPSSHNWVEQTTLLPSYQYQYAGEGTVPYPPEASSEAWTFEDELNKDNEPQEFESRPEGNEKI